jgi:hypothetical protein
MTARARLAMHLNEKCCSQLGGASGERLQPGIGSQAGG